VFEAGGFGVALTVSRADPRPFAEFDAVPPGVTRRPSRLTEVLDVERFSDAELVRRFVMTDDGVLLVTTPSGVTRTTRPPGLHLTADLLLTGGGAAPDPDDPSF
jgi:hypothetical protein